ncbi:hypothetical protein [Flavonifractor plautii]|uniref:hypothetical protein n=1 Tax=Flavonifractor plautii TaxID=292800 RepID=UPI00195C8725|nr:hypothetical protein [Flavonifractor plautii]MBM6663792.1 hypothetical protein [Flavonifractor plautii]
MERSKRRRRRNRGLERLKTLLIVLLSLSALYLTGLVLVQNRAASGSQGVLSGLLSLFRPQSTVETSDPGSSGQLTAAARPVRIAVCDGVNRYAVQYNTAQTDKLYDSVGILLGEALSSAYSPTVVTESVWQAALSSPGVWFDFLGKIPLETLSAWTGEGGVNTALTGSARRIAVALADDGVRLYYHNESDGLYYTCKTAVTYQGHMDELVAGYGGNGVPFAFELGTDSGYDGLDPYVLISASTPTPGVYRASNPLASLDEALIGSLQQALSFQTSYYAIPNGIRIREGQETLEISNTGTVSYTTAEGTSSRYPVGSEYGYDITEVVETTRRMAADTVGRYCGAARIYLMEVEETEAGLSVRYGYSLNGAEVSLSGSDSAALFTIQDGQITSFTLRFRRYEDTGQTSLVLGERMAAAALEALDPEERELVLCYSDSGGDTVQAGWVAK